MNRKLAFWATISYALVVRFKGLSTGLPLHTLYGENDTLQMLLLMMRTGDLNPHQFVYPGLAYYIYLPFFYMFYGVGHVIGFFPTLASVSESSFLFVGRCVCAALGTASVYLVYRIGKFFSETTALIAMAVMAAVPQHTEFSHMLRPEIPAIFFALIAQWAALSILDSPKRKTFWILGIAAGASFSTKYNIGLPLILTMAVTFVIAAKQIRWYWPIESAIFFLLLFAATNPFLVANPASILYWMRRVDALYNPAEDYYARNIVFYYLEFLTRYDYNLPLILAALIGIVLLPLTSRARGTLVLIYPLAVFIWLCTFDARRIQSLLPLHPYLALLSACTLHALWRLTRKISASPVFSATYAILLAAILFFPYYRSNIQTYLFSKLDNRSKAELWMTNRLPQGARVALLEFNQIELDPTYFQIQSFAPRDYVDQKDFNWFFQQGFDYVIVSSGQYMRYFVEGQNAQKYRDYFLKFFQDAGQKGTLVLDLATHPTEIPDYRIKVYSTQKLHVPPSFFPSIDTEPGNAQYHLEKSDAYLELQPGYYSLAIPPKTDQNNFIRVRNLKLNELILRRVPDSGLSAEEAVSLFPFAIFPARLRSRFSLFSNTHSQISPGQIVQFRWTGIPGGLDIKQIQPAIDIKGADFSPTQSQDLTKPYLLFRKSEDFSIQCTLANKVQLSMAGYVQAFLSEIGEPQPWRDFESSSAIHEFSLDPGQEITIDIPLNTDMLTGDHQLSFWIFTRHDLPFSPQNGGWFNKQIRVDDPRLGIHPIYGIPIP